MKKFARDIITLTMSTKNHNHMRYSCWDTEWEGQNFCYFGPFFALLPNEQPGKSKFWKNEKSMWRCHHFEMSWRCTKNQDHIIYASSDRVWETEFFFLFWPFPALLPLKNQKIKILWKWKKCRTYYYFTDVYHKWKLYDV